ncbi:MAG: hypothetical protein EOP84_16030 [Verrucomicrobiaceae bacterium]|nr:MAG: hypothetical protein EOP84_16030 [Verrucomicrobiaceae bacterium]
MEQHTAIVSIEMRIDAGSDQLSPVRYYVETPAFVRELEARFQVYVGNTRVTPTATRITTREGTSNFLANLEDPRRSVPLVVVTEPAGSTPPIPDLADRLARFLYGLAIVIDINRASTYDLSDSIGKDMSVFDGGLRIYWPRWSRFDSLRDHPLYLRSRVELSKNLDSATPDRLVRSSLMSRITRASATRFAHPSAIVEVLDRARLRSLKQELESTTTHELVQKLSELRGELIYAQQLKELAVTEHAELRVELDLTRRELAGTNRELERLRALVSSPQLEQSPWDLVDPHEALARARTEFGTTLVIPEGVHVDTKESGAFWYHALLSLHELCELDRRGEAARKRETLAGLLAENGLGPKNTYKAGDTGVFIKNPYTGDKIEVRERVHLVEGKPADTETVYWVTLGEARAGYRYLIGRIGRHA